MDIRLAMILAERGSNHPEAVALRRLMATSRQLRVGRGRTGRIKYKEPRDLTRLPRNPVEKKAREELSLFTGLVLRLEKQPVFVAPTKKQIEARMTPTEREKYSAKYYAQYYEEFFRAR